MIHIFGGEEGKKLTARNVKIIREIAENRHLIVHHTDRNKLNVTYLIMLMRKFSMAAAMLDGLAL